MPLIILAVTCGVLCVGFLPVLPDLIWLFLVLPLTCVRLVRAWRWLSILLALVLGMSWGIIHGHLLMRSVLPEQWVGKDLLVTGRIVDLPIADERRQRFIVQVETANLLDQQSSVNLVADSFPRKLQISWYEKNALAPASGEHWQFVVRLKRPRGFVNPGGFDYQIWLLRQDIGGVGYIRSSSLNQQLGESEIHDISAWRYALKRWLLASTDSPQTGVMLALLIGDRSLIGAEQWRVMQLTGINHLVSISGLHVGFLAILGFAMGVQMGRCLNIVWHRCPALLVGYACAMCCAFIYSGLAGFNIPTQRTLIMVLTIQLAFFLRRSYRSGQVFLLALLVIVLNDPLAAYDIGFWLSFGAVAVLLFCFAGRYSTAGVGRWARINTQGRGLLSSQWIIFIGLFLPLSLLTSSASLLAPVANILAIPLVTFAVVPALLLAAAVHWWLPAFSKFLLTLVDLGLGLLDQWLKFLLMLGDGRMNPVINFNGWAFALATLAVLILLLPRGIPGRWLGYPGILIALILPARPAPDLKLTVLDVGQGLAVVIQTPHYRLLYDTGPAYSEKFEAGSAIVAPFLRQQGIDTLDKLVVSHNDRDHAGGLGGLLDGIAVRELLAGEPEKTRLNKSSLVLNPQDCHQHSAWQWDQVKFRFLDTSGTSHNNANNHSCVLLIEHAGAVILLPGDIEGRLENRLLDSGQLPSPVTLVLASHHGSRSSSFPKFVEHIQARFVVYSAGYRSQHGHPHAEVVARFVASQSHAFNTAEHGALSFVWEEGVLQSVTNYRQAQRRYWFD